jgi:outer membrane protein assembly factor BamB
MPTVEGTRVKCPECGATSNAQGEVIKCEYCGTESRVQKRTAVFQMPVKLPKLEPHHPQRVAVQVRTRVWPVVLIVVVSVLVPVVILATALLHQRGKFLWSGDHPLIVDLDGDGTSDAIGIARYVSGDKMKLRAISGKDGHAFWETDSLGTYIDTYQNIIAVSGTTLMFGATNKRPRLDAYDLKTGKKLWSVVPPEVVEALCAGQPGWVTLETKDKVMYTVDLATGKLTEIVTNECAPLGSNGRHSSENPHRKPQVFGMHIDRVMGSAAPFVLSGSKSPGTPIPMIAAVDADDHVLWKSEVPADHFATNHTDAYVAIDDHLVVAMFDHEKDTDPPSIAGFDRATGKRLFTTDTKYTGHMFVSMHGIDLATDVIFTTVESSIQGFDPKTGERRFVVGTTD